MLAEMGSEASGNAKGMVAACCALLADLPEIYRNLTAPSKRLLVGSLWPGKITVSRTENRTACENPLLTLLCGLKADLPTLENKKPPLAKRLSHSVLRAGIEPAHALRHTGF